MVGGAHPTMREDELCQRHKAIVLLIDADNSPAKSIQKILAELARHGKVNIRRAYGNWTSSNLKDWESVLQDHAIQPIQQDAMDILYTKNIDAFCIVTSDCDFTPLATRILSDGKMVVGFGERKTPLAFVNACSTFLFLDDDVEKIARKREPNELKGDTKLMNLLRDGISSTTAEGGWARLSRVGSHIANHASFDPRNYGYSRLSDLVEAVGLFELKRDDGKHFIIRDGRK